MENQDINNSNLPKEIKLDNDNLNPLLDIVASLQEKLSESNQSFAKNNTYATQNSNYTGNNANTSTKNNSESNGFDASKLFELLNSINSNNQKTTTSDSASNPFANIDINTAIRLSKIFSSMNREDPRKNLLLSLKPFLRDNRQRNVDTYIFILGILNALDAFNNEESGF